MKRNLEYTLKVQAESAHESLFSWYIQEHDESGRAIGKKFIPWNWTLPFRVSSFSYTTDIEAEMNYGNGVPARQEIRRGSMIKAILEPDTGEFRKMTFSMFGTERTINVFELRILPTTEDSQAESLTVSASVSYDHDDEHGHETEPDCLEFTMYVSHEFFSHILDRLERPHLKASFSFRTLHGFYAEWTPLVRTDFVKVLAQPTTLGIQQASLVLGEGISELPTDLHRTGPVQDYHLGITNQFSVSSELSYRDLALKNKSLEGGTDGGEFTSKHSGQTSNLESIKYGIWAIALVTLFHSCA